MGIPEDSGRDWLRASQSHSQPVWMRGSQSRAAHHSQAWKQLNRKQVFLLSLVGSEGSDPGLQVPSLRALWGDPPSAPLCCSASESRSSTSAAIPFLNVKGGDGSAPLAGAGSA